MKTPRRFPPFPSAITLAASLFAAAAVLSPRRLQAQGQAAVVKQRTFAAPEDAAKALRAAAEAGDKAAIGEIFGPDYRDFLTGDAAQDAADFKRFSLDLEEKLVPVTDAPDKVVFEIGARGWPFPIPLVKKNERWSFDTNAGKEEIVDRRVGKDELHAIGVCRAYAKGPGRREDVPGPKSVHGYFFKALAKQGESAPGGATTGGFALVAYPERWGRSGVMTFIVNQDGKVYRRDLGRKTAKIAAAMTEFDPNGRWMIESEQGIDDAGDSRSRPTR